MKKFLMFVLTIVLMMSVSFAQEIGIVLNGEKLKTDVAPLEIEGRVMVPVRVISEKLGATVDFNFDTNQIKITSNNSIIDLTLESKNAYINKTLKKLDVPAKEINNRTLVPIRFVGEALGADVAWDDKTWSVYITSSHETTSNQTIAMDGADSISKNGKFEIVEYSRSIRDFNAGFQRIVNGVSDSKVDFTSNYLSFSGVSWASGKEYEDGFKELTYEEALNFRDTYADIAKCVTDDWIQENFTSDKIYLLVNSTNFNPIYTAFPTAEYDEQNNAAYLIFEKEHEHWKANWWIDGIEEKIKKEAKSTVTLLILDKANVDNLDKIYIVLPEQFVEEDDNIEVSWIFYNEDELINEDVSQMSFMLFDSKKELPYGFLEVSANEAREFIKKYFISEKSPNEINEFLYNRKLFIINSDELTGANNLTTNLRALDGTGKLYVELYSDVKAAGKGTKCVLVALAPELFEKYEEITFVVDDN